MINELQINNPNTTVEKMLEYYRNNISSLDRESDLWDDYIDLRNKYNRKYGVLAIFPSLISKLSQSDLNQFYKELQQLININNLSELQVIHPHLNKWKFNFIKLVKEDVDDEDPYWEDWINEINKCTSKEDIIKVIYDYSNNEESIYEFYEEKIFNMNESIFPLWDKIKQPINEEQHVIYRVEVLIKTKAEVNKVFVYNSIRGLTGVVVLTIEQNDYLDTQATNQYEYSLLKMKFMVISTPKEEIQKIKKDALITNKIDGLLQFLPRLQTIEKIGEY